MKKNTLLNLIAISYAKKTLEEGTREQVRMQSYARVMNQLHIIVFTKKSEGYTFQKIENLYVHPTNAQTKVGMLWAAYVIGRQIIKQQTMESWVVTSQDPFETSLIGRAIAAGKRATHHVQIHGDLFNPRSYQGSLLQRLRVVYGRFVVRRTSAIRAVSQRILQSLLALGVSEKVISVVPIQANMEAFLAVGHDRVYTVTPEIQFLYIGRFAREKNLPFLLTCFALVVKKYPHHTLTLLGSGPELPHIKRLITQYQLESQVCIKGWTDSVSEVISQHDVLCVTSNHEGWGMVMQEAAAAGMPVCTTDVGCAGELILHGQNGFVSPVADARGYITGLMSYCEQPSRIEQHGRAGHVKAQSFTCSETEYLQQLVESYPSFVR